ncbi:hypothetical protein PoB_000179200 [Plakobranchus ocellatus]|uniref:Uncharacterized protein n=1 Tax=Plakobranchus ocellatus TaxID=259542 RepID=A0AAV3XXU4_9GAST|nr:hypothetical protein PoB_000179200 [Plakobranchus ocellatus]
MVKSTGNKICPKTRFYKPDGTINIQKYQWKSQNLNRLVSNAVHRFNQRRIFAPVEVWLVGCLHMASPQQDDLRLSGPLSGQGAGSGALTCGRRVPADLREHSLTLSHRRPHTRGSVRI